MATLAASAVSVTDTWKGEGTSSRKFLFKDVTLTLTGHGGLTNTILAALFGMSKIIGVKNARNASSVLINAAPSYDNASIVIYQPSYPSSLPVLSSYIVTGANGAANITVTGLATTDTIIAVQDLGGASAYVVAVQKTLSHYTIGSANTMAQAAGAGDTSAKKLLVLTHTPQTAAFNSPTDITDTVRLTIFGYE